MADDKKNPHEVPDTGHEWDGIRELDNPPPRWWTISLYLSGLFVLIYFILYPSLPLVTGSTKGLLGWTMIKEYKEGVAKIEEKRAPFEQQLERMTAEEILEDDTLRNYVVASTRVLYGDNCAACHGVGGQPVAGSGYPILNNDDWLYGGTLDKLIETLAKGRQGMMPAHEFLSEAEVTELVQFVIDSSEGVATEAGKALYAEKGCAVCHGAEAKGNQQIGAPNLTDKVWRFSGEPDEVRRTIVYGVNNGHPKARVAIMPGWNEKLAVKLEALEYGDDPEDYYDGTETERLTETEIKKLAIYVHQLGGGQ